MSRILAIEDSAAIRLLLLRRLARAGHLVELIADPVAAVRALEKAPAGDRPDLILLDLGLHGQDGLETLPGIAAAVPDVPVVLLSARHDLDRLDTPVPVAGRVAKPIDFERLLGLIGRFTGPDAVIQGP